ncbi:EF hand domain-containing protein [Ditylenchus destructor]|uniref:EF hand domain-containing protein n=1 Tax=Ditylenchus destructor TaxID=166010 RepID=A0AAD4MG09_9BILA|nr:EF hand domain-containing protein [Ditylenchus destructor]
MKVSALVFLTAFVLLNISTVHSDKIDEYFKKFDLNGDGKISHEEIETLIEQVKELGIEPGSYATALRLVLSLTDANKDGFVTLDELRNFPETFFKAIDENGDGKLSFEEYKAFVEKFYLTGLGSEVLRAAFDKTDLDKDGYISLEEYEKGIAEAIDGQTLGSVFGK